jgi:hypothetical protein
MIRLNRNCIRSILWASAFLFFTIGTASLHPIQVDIRLVPPGLRPTYRPTLVLPADFSYSNRPLSFPNYCDKSGRPAEGWSRKYIATRRFASDQSAWIYYRRSDIAQLLVKEAAGAGSTLRIWPGGTTLVIEIFKGYALPRNNVNPIEIAVMSKLGTGQNPAAKHFFPIRWSYARFKPAGTSFITPDKVRECHQCHSIAFHLTGDLVFSDLP